jgi:hypothetical protein
MKAVLFYFTLSLPLVASAQKLVASQPPVTYRVGSESASLYRTAADTANKSKWFLSPGEEAYVVGRYSPHWVIVQRTGALYLLAAQRLPGYSPADLDPLPIDPQTHRITYEGVVEVPGVSKSDLFTRANAWVVHAYRSANDVVQMQDKEAGQLIVKGLTRVSIGGVVRHTLTIYVKDGRYKYVLTDLTHDASGVQNGVSGGPLERSPESFSGFGNMGKKNWAEIQRRAGQDAHLLTADLQAAMALKGTKDPSDF